MKKDYTKLHIDIPFTTVGGEIKHLPTQMNDDASLFMLYAQKTIYINPGARVHIPTGIRLNLPDIVEASPDNSRYSKLTLQATLHTSSYLVEAKGVAVLSPTVLPATYRSDLVLCCVNLTKEVQTVGPGDELAILAFNLVPRIQLQLAPTLTLKGKPYVI